MWRKSRNTKSNRIESGARGEGKFHSRIVSTYVLQIVSGKKKRWAKSSNNSNKDLQISLQLIQDRPLERFILPYRALLHTT